jgi:uncharacterized protein
MSAGKVEMEVVAITMDPTRKTPIVLLNEIKGERSLPLWIGTVEATAIAMGLENISVSRPLTHDLFSYTLQSLGAKLLDVLIVELRAETYYALLTVQWGAQQMHIDARPSDAIALAIRSKAPIYCAESVLTALQRQGSVENDGPRLIMKTDGKTPKQILEELKPEDFGRYSM